MENGKAIGDEAFSGRTAARTILRCHTSELLTQHGPELHIYPSENITQWPPELRERIKHGQSTTSEMSGE